MLMLIVAAQLAAPAPELANPAAVFCVAQGGRHEIRAGEGGETGVCILPDGTETDAWDYFRRHAPRDDAAPAGRG